MTDTIFNQSYPVAFRVLNEKYEEKIYLENKPSSGLLELSNESGEDIHFIPPKDPSMIAGSQNFHFALKFRPGILKSTVKSLIKNKLIKKGWALSIGLVPLDEAEVREVLFPDLSVNDNFTTDEILKKVLDAVTAFVEETEKLLGLSNTVLYFLNTNKSSFTKEEKIILPLKELMLQCDQGTQVTQVELFCNNLSTDANYTKRLDSQIRHYDLTIVNHRGSPHMPIHVGFTGFNAILNDGASPNLLNLRITNLQKETPENSGKFIFNYRKNSKIYLYFNTDKKSSEYAIGTTDSVSEIELKITQPDQEFALVHEPIFEGDTPVWEIYPEDGDVILQPHLTTLKNNNEPSNADLPDDSCFDIALSGIITNFLMGATDLYLRFENIPGYWDHAYAIPIVKQPLIFKDQRVGLGTTTPSAMLDVNGSGWFRQDAWYLPQTAGIGVRVFYDRILDLGSLFVFDYQNNSPRNMILQQPGGNVGIGTHLPARKLEVNNAMKFSNGSGDANDGVIGTAPFTAGLNIVGINTDGQGRKINSWGSFIQNENPTGNKFLGDTNFPGGAWKNSGNAGIGTTDPSARLDVNGSGWFRQDAWNLPESAGTGVRIFYDRILNVGSIFAYDYPTATGKDLIFQQPGGNVGIGIDSPTSKLDVNGNIKAIGYRCRRGVNDSSNAGGPNVFNIEWNGASASLWIDATPFLLFGTSDRRLKENIQSMQNNALGKVMRLRPVNFNFRDMEGAAFKGSPEIHDGFIADELQLVIPSAVKGEKDALTSDGKIQPQSLNWAPIVSVLTKAIQEQQAQIDSLKSENEKLKTELNEIKKDIIGMKEMMGIKMAV